MIPLPASALTVGVLAAVLISAAAPAALAEDTSANRPTTLELSADGEVQAAPDVAYITLGVHSEAATAAGAMARNAEQMNRIVAALKAAGLPAKDIQTSSISLAAQYDTPDNQPPRLRGYQASNTVALTVEEVGRLGPTLDAATAAGANQIENVGFGLKDPLAAQDEARLKAVKALKAKADLYAGATGMRLGRLLDLSESNASIPMADARPMVMAGYRKAAPTPVEAGELTVRVSVSAHYILAP